MVRHYTFFSCIAYILCLQLNLIMWYNNKEGVDTDFTMTFPLEAFTSPAAYGHAIQIAYDAFTKQLQEGETPLPVKED